MLLLLLYYIISYCIPIRLLVIGLLNYSINNLGNIRDIILLFSLFIPFIYLFIDSIL